jgi:hypothetical protein
MERLKVINVRGGGGIAKKGVQAELELVEGASRVYPETTPFLPLLATLIHTLQWHQSNCHSPSLSTPFQKTSVNHIIRLTLTHL